MNDELEIPLDGSIASGLLFLPLALKGGIRAGASEPLFIPGGRSVPDSIIRYSRISYEEPTKVICWSAQNGGGYNHPTLTTSLCLHPTRKMVATSVASL